MLRSKSPTFIAGAILTFAILLITFTFYGYQIFFSPNFAFEKKKEYLYIPTGAVFTDVIDSLESNDLLHHKMSFAFTSKLLGYQDNVKPGRYAVYQKETNLSLIRRLKRGEQEPLKLTFNNIRLKKDFAERISERMEFSFEELDSLLNSPQYLEEHGFNSYTILSMFIPNTYEIFWTTPADKFFERMHSEYKKFWNEERLEKAKAIGLSPVEVTTLASIVEAETRMSDEKPRVAGVYMNRLKKGMLLQADPTVVYAIGDFTMKRVYKGATKFDSPYNTYMYAGLPPGPINMPSITSMDAVLNFEKHKYEYFCASPDFSGYHVFAESYEAHQKNARSYQKALNKSRIR
ncbi:MAG: endolytic transglycosylase MltG [Cytophagaceae bacterium]